MTKNTDVHDHFLEVIRDFATGMLLTHAEGDRMHARPMAMAEVQPDGNLYFATSIGAPKISEIDAGSKVTVTFQSDSAFAALSGSATVVRDPKLVERVWCDAWRAWWPGGKDDPSLALIRVDAEDGEYWDNAGLQGVKYALETAKAYASGEKPEIDTDQHGKTAL